MHENKYALVYLKRFINELFPCDDDKRVKLVTLPYFICIMNECGESNVQSYTGIWKWKNEEKRVEISGSAEIIYWQIWCMFGGYKWNSLNLPEMRVHFDSCCWMFVFMCVCKWLILWVEIACKRIQKVVDVEPKQNKFLDSLIQKETKFHKSCCHVQCIQFNSIRVKKSIIPNIQFD